MLSRLGYRTISTITFFYGLFVCLFLPLLQLIVHAKSDFWLLLDFSFMSLGDISHQYVIFHVGRYYCWNVQCPVHFLMERKWVAYNWYHSSFLFLRVCERRVAHAWYKPERNPESINNFYKTIATAAIQLHFNWWYYPPLLSRSVSFSNHHIDHFYHVF